MSHFVHILYDGRHYHESCENGTTNFDFLEFKINIRPVSLELTRETLLLLCSICFSNNVFTLSLKSVRSCKECSLGFTLYFLMAENIEL